MYVSAGAEQADDAPANERLVDVRFTAHPSGHSLGGAIWVISVQQQDFIYAVHMNLRSDGHLAGCRVQTLFDRPALLITDVSCLGRADPPANEAAAFQDAVLNVLRKCDPSPEGTRRGRVCHHHCHMCCTSVTHHTH